eukprot:3400179-Amphidinium_carterae.1
MRLPADKKTEQYLAKGRKRFVGKNNSKHVSQGKIRVANLTHSGKRAAKRVGLLQHESDERSQAVDPKKGCGWFKARSMVHVFFDISHPGFSASGLNSYAHDTCIDLAFCCFPRRANPRECVQKRSVRELTKLFENTFVVTQAWCSDFPKLLRLDGPLCRKRVIALSTLYCAGTHRQAVAQPP